MNRTKLLGVLTFLLIASLVAAQGTYFQLNILYTANQTSANFPAGVVPTVTAPAVSATSGIIPTSGYGANSYVNLSFFGTDANNEEFDVLVVRWYQDTATTLWVPVQQGIYDCILGSGVGVSGQSIDNTEFLVDTITFNSGSGDDNYSISSNGANRTASLRVNPLGAPFIGVYPAVNDEVTSATAFNVAWSRY